MREKISSSVEDYLKTIYGHTEWQDKPMSSSELALRLNVAKSSVSEMIYKLKRAGLVTHVPYGKIHLTQTGRARALQIVRRHRLLETFLAAELHYSWDEVHAEAENLEHVVSETFMERLAQKLGHPSHDPHGDPIPQADGTIAIPPSQPLHQLAVGESGTLIRISDMEPDVLRALGKAPINLGDTLTVQNKTESADRPDGQEPTAGPATITVLVHHSDDSAPAESEPNGAQQEFPSSIAAALWVQKTPTSRPRHPAA